LLRNVTQFVLAAILVVAGMTFLTGGAYFYALPWLQVEVARRGFALSAVVLGAAAIVVVQYARRRATLARAIGGAALIAGAMVHLWLPREFSAVLQCGASPGDTIRDPVSVRFAPGQHLVSGETPFPRWPGTNVIVAVPIEVSGLRQDTIAHFGQVALEVTGPSGQRFKAEWPTRTAPSRKIPFTGYIWPPNQPPKWQILSMDSSVFNRLKDGVVAIQGKLIMGFSQRGDPTWMAVGGDAMVPRLGRCTTTFSEDRLGEDMLGVHCESPDALPLTRVKLVDPTTGQDWDDGLGAVGTWMAHPRSTWLSPLNRRDTFFHLTTEDVSRREGSRWLVPRRAIGGARLALTPEHPTGCSIVTYEMPDIPLSSFVTN
jgi:hypothetical protein